MVHKTCLRTDIFSCTWVFGYIDVNGTGLGCWGVEVWFRVPVTKPITDKILFLILITWSCLNSNQLGSYPDTWNIISKVFIKISVNRYIKDENTPFNVELPGIKKGCQLTGIYRGPSYNQVSFVKYVTCNTLKEYVQCMVLFK